MKLRINFLRIFEQSFGPNQRKSFVVDSNEVNQEKNDEENPGIDFNPSRIKDF